MTTRHQRDRLKSQLIETERLHEMVAGHPFMSHAFAVKKEELVRQLAELPEGGREARTVLFFAEGPVQGSRGIDASFVGQVLPPFQNMVMADYADHYFGSVGSRGRRPGEAQARLLLTALPRGSFGLELAKADSEELFEEDQLADTLVRVTKLVEAAARSDEDFAAQLDDTAPRVIQNLRDFLQVISKAEASLALESGDQRCSLTPAEAAAAHDRVSGTVTEEKEIEAEGVFRGVLLDSRRFDFTAQNGTRLTGRLAEDLSEETVAAWHQEHFGRPCRARLRTITVTFKNGRVRTSHCLLELHSMPTVTP